jgi:hypothetical protein
MLVEGCFARLGKDTVHSPTANMSREREIVLLFPSFWTSLKQNASTETWKKQECMYRAQYRGSHARTRYSQSHTQPLQSNQNICICLPDVVVSTSSYFADTLHYNATLQTSCITTLLCRHATLQHHFADKLHYNATLQTRCIKQLFKIVSCLSQTVVTEWKFLKSIYFLRISTLCFAYHAAKDTLHTHTPRHIRITSSVLFVACGYSHQNVTSTI